MAHYNKKKEKKKLEVSNRGRRLVSLLIPGLVCPWEATSMKGWLWRFQLMEIRGRFRLKGILILVGLVGLVCFTAYQAISAASIMQGDLRCYKNGI